MSVEVNELSVNGVDYIRKDSVTQQPVSGDVRIVILQRGWVMIGHYGQDGAKCWLDGASVVRVWGTTKGLGQLALSGPTSKTVLDPAGRVEFHEMTVVARLSTDAKLWKF